MSTWGPSPPQVLQIHSPCHRHSFPCSSSAPWNNYCHFSRFGTNCMVPSDWDLAPKCVCGPNFISYLIGESPIVSAARIAQKKAKIIISLFLPWQTKTKERKKEKSTLIFKPPCPWDTHNHFSMKTWLSGSQSPLRVVCFTNKLLSTNKQTSVQTNKLLSTSVRVRANIDWCTET